jgi:hypothetical protein
MMTRYTRLVVFAGIAFVAIASAGCVDEGIGMGVPTSGMRITGSSNTPSVLVGGGPVY